MNHRLRIIHAALVVDGAGRRWAPGAIAIDDHGRLLEAGPPDTIGPLPDRRTPESHPQATLLPGLVNVHAHLDLTHLGTRPAGPDFRAWVDMVRAGRCTDEAGIAASVAAGVERCRAGGTVLVGDIAGAGSFVPVRVQRERGLGGVSFLEVFGIGRSRDRGVATLRAAADEVPAFVGGVRFGVQPHAPYSCDLAVYECAASLGLPCSTHLAETLDERRFVEHATGPFRDLLESIGVWDDGIVAHGRHPIDHLAPVLAQTPFVAAHLNDIEARHIEVLARTSTTVAYCPRASAYFGHPAAGEAPHAYRSMLAGGVNVALGTDSILCLDTPDRISTLDEMRLLRRRDGTDSVTLLAMATIHGARALGFDEGLVEFSPGPMLGVLAVDGAGDDPLDAALRGNAPPRWVAGPFPCPPDALR